MSDRASPQWLVAGLVLFVAGIALGISLIGRLAPAPEPPIIAARLSEFDADRDAYDTLFFGSSRIFRGVDPVLFDARTAELGQPTRSFSLGFPAMRPHESHALMRRVLADHRPANLRTVLIELDDWKAEVPDPIPDEAFVDIGRFSARAVKWHDAVETRSVFRTIWLGRDAPREKLHLAGLTLSHWGAHTFRVGAAAMALRADDTPDPVLVTGARRGFTPFVARDEVEGFPSIWRRGFLRNTDQFLRRLRGRRKANAAVVSIEHYNLRALKAQIALVREAGATPVYVMPPRGDATPHLYQLVAQGHIPAFLEFGDPERYPELFTLEARFDSQHLMPPAAASFTLHLADQFARWQGGR